MSARQELTFAFGSYGIEKSRKAPDGAAARGSIPRVARLMALAIRLEGLVREGTIQDYAEAARIGRVTRARMTQIIKLLDLAPDIQESILFLPPLPHLNERNLRPVVAEVAWDDQRRRFQRIAGPLFTSEGLV